MNQNGFIITLRDFGCSPEQDHRTKCNITSQPVEPVSCVGEVVSKIRTLTIVIVIVSRARG
jgi:hypothetical protein